MRIKSFSKYYITKIFFERALLRFDWLYFLPAFIPMLFLVVAVIVSGINEKRNHKSEHSNTEEENNQTIPILDNANYQLTEQNSMGQRNNNTQQIINTQKQQPILNLNTQTNAIKNGNNPKLS